MKRDINKEESGFERLSTAIILQAVTDYREGLRKILSGKVQEGDVEVFIDAQDFFCSEFFSLFTDVDPLYIRKRIIKEALEEALEKGDENNGY